MVDATTTNYGWTKPTVGADSDAWGGLINTNLDGIDTTVKAVSVVANAAVPKAGGTMTGALTNSSGFVGPLTGAVTGNVTGNLTGAVTGNVTGNCSGSSGSCTGNAATATTATTASAVANGSVGVAGLTNGAPNWDASGNTSLGGNLTIGGSRGRITDDGTNIVFQFASGTYILYDANTNVLAIVKNGVTVQSY